MKVYAKISLVMAALFLAAFTISITMGFVIVATGQIYSFSIRGYTIFEFYGKATGIAFQFLGKSIVLTGEVNIGLFFMFSVFLFLAFKGLNIE